MATALRPLATNPFQQFRYDLEKESPRAAYWLESMIYGMLAQVDGMTEDIALELACKIVIASGSPQMNGKRATLTNSPRPGTHSASAAP